MVAYGKFNIAGNISSLKKWLKCARHLNDTENDI